MAQSTTNLGKIHVFPSESLYNQFKDIIADNDLALLKDDGAYIVAANLAQNGYVKFSNGLILQWGYKGIGGDKNITFPVRVNAVYCIALGTENSGTVVSNIQKSSVTNTGFSLWQYDNNQYNVPCWWLMLGK